MLAKTAEVASKLRAAGGKVMHAPIMFKADNSDNPNKGLGILAGCAKDSLFVEGTWNAGARTPPHHADRTCSCLSSLLVGACSHHVCVCCARRVLRADEAG